MNPTVSRYVRIVLLILVGYLLAISFGHFLYVILQAILWIPITAFSWSFKILTSRSGFDPIRCASLHNEIVSKIPASMLEEHHTKIVHNWFTAYGKEASKIRWKLTSPLIKFLENIDVPLRTDGGWTPINIAPHVHLASPGDLWSPVGGLGTDGLNLNDWDWVALYTGTCSTCLQRSQYVLMSCRQYARGRYLLQHANQSRSLAARRHVLGATMVSTRTCT